MKKQDILFYSALGLITLSIIVLVLFKFVFVSNSNFAIEGLEQLTVTDLHGNKLNLADYLKKNDRVYVLLFGLTDCNSCVFRGIEDLKVLKKAGKQIVALVINDDIEDVKAWAKHYDSLTILILNKVDFFENITCVKTPVMITFQKGKVKGYRYILPQ